MRKLIPVTILFLSILCGSASAEPGKFCWSVQRAMVVPCPVKGPPPLCDSGEHCDAAACWCGPTDAYMGPDHTGLPLVAREVEASGYPCVLVESDGAVSGECSGWYSWLCDADARCSDDIGNRWRPRF